MPGTMEGGVVMDELREAIAGLLFHVHVRAQDAGDFEWAELDERYRLTWRNQADEFMTAVEVSPGVALGDAVRAYLALAALAKDAGEDDDSVTIYDISGTVCVGGSWYGPTLAAAAIGLESYVSKIIADARDA